MIDMVVPRRDLRDTLIRIIGLLMRPGPVAEIVPLDGGALDIPMPATTHASDNMPVPDGS